MSQKTVQLIIGRILSASEVEALVRTDRRLWTDASSRIDPRLQRCSLPLTPERRG
jgi:hypothetical protein